MDFPWDLTALKRPALSDCMRGTPLVLSETCFSNSRLSWPSIGARRRQLSVVHCQWAQTGEQMCECVGSGCVGGVGVGHKWFLGNGLNSCHFTLIPPFSPITTTTTYSSCNKHSRENLSSSEREAGLMRLPPRNWQSRAQPSTQSST